MPAILLRTLTEKSKLGFGDRMLKELPVSNLLMTARGRTHLTKIYFNLGNINYTDDVLNQLGITDKYRINKPGKNKDLGYEFVRNEVLGKMTDMERIKRWSKKKKQRKIFANNIQREELRKSNKASLSYKNRSLPSGQSLNRSNKVGY